MAAAASALVITTSLGRIVLALRPDAAPRTVEHVTRLCAAKVWDGTSFYRSDFVIQMGTHGTAKRSPHAPLAVNEATARGRLSNARGAMAVAHWDVPDCGDTEVFISLKDNAHLDTACAFPGGAGRLRRGARVHLLIVHARKRHSRNAAPRTSFSSQTAATASLRRWPRPTRRRGRLSTQSPLRCCAAKSRPSSAPPSRRAEASAIAGAAPLKRARARR